MFASYNSSGAGIQEPGVVNDPAEKLLRQARRRHVVGLVIKIMIAVCFLVIAIFAISALIVANVISNKVHAGLAAEEARIKQDDLKYQGKVQELERRREALERKKEEYRARRPSDRESAAMHKEESDLRQLSSQIPSTDIGDSIGKPLGEGMSDAMRFAVFLIKLAVVVLSVLAYFFLPALVAFPPALLLIFTWRDPANIILLRPFFMKDASKSVKYLIRGGLAGFGFIYTLSDSHMRQKWYVKYPVLLGNLSFLQFRFRRVTRLKTVDRFVRAVNRRRWRIFNWAVSWSKVFPVTCVDKHWQYFVSKLLLSADIILIDLTGEKSNVVWEIQECERLGLTDRVIFIQREERPEYILRGIFKGADGTSHEVIRYRQSERLCVDEVMRAVALKLTNSDARIKRAA